MVNSNIEERERHTIFEAKGVRPIFLGGEEPGWAGDSELSREYVVNVPGEEDVKEDVQVN